MGLTFEDADGWEAMAEELYETSENLDAEEYDDQRPATMVKVTLKVLACLIYDYKKDNREMTYLFASLMMDFMNEMLEEEKDNKRLESLLEGVNLD